MNPSVVFNNKNILRSTLPSESMLIGINLYIDSLNSYYSKSFDSLYLTKETIINKLQSTPEKLLKMRRIKSEFTNRSLGELVKNLDTKNELAQVDNDLVRVIDPIYKTPDESDIFGIKGHFYSAYKRIGTKEMSTYFYNILFIWIFSTILYFTLYYDLFAILINKIENWRFIKSTESN